MNKLQYAFLTCAVIGAVLIAEQVAGAHGYVGDRLFPATITTDDPLAVDELGFTFAGSDLPPGDGDPRTHQLDFSGEFDKEIFPHFAVGVSDDWLSLKPLGDKRVSGFDNIELSAKYELYRNEKHEFIVALGLLADIGGSGSTGVGADSFSTFTPTLYFGKGFGDLPDALSALKPFALTGTLGQTFPTSADPATLQWGLALEYSLPYLQQHVADIGLPEPFKSMIPVVEFSMQTGENRGQKGLTTGTINPGFMWEFKYFQLGAEALIPVNGESGQHVGGIFQVEIYIDDIFPNIFGHPIFGG